MKLTENQKKGAAIGGVLALLLGATYMSSASSSESDKDDGWGGGGVSSGGGFQSMAEQIAEMVSGQNPFAQTPEDPFFPAPEPIPDESPLLDTPPFYPTVTPATQTDTGGGLSLHERFVNWADPILFPGKYDKNVVTLGDVMKNPKLAFSSDSYTLGKSSTGAQTKAAQGAEKTASKSSGGTGSARVVDTRTESGAAAMAGTSYIKIHKNQNGKTNGKVTVY